MGHLRIWIWMLACMGMGYLSLCLMWSPEFDLSRTGTGDVMVPAMRAGGAAELAIDVPMWALSWQPEGPGRTDQAWVSRTGSGCHRVAWRVQPVGTTTVTWSVRDVPFLMRGLGILFGARPQMEDALTRLLESEGQGDESVH